jgi:integrase
MSDDAKPAKPKLLTDKAIGALKKAPAGKRVLRYDGGAGSVPGFAVMVTDRGARSYVLVARFPKTGKPARRLIARVGALSLAKAREKAQQWREWIGDGRDPAEMEAAQKRAIELRRADLFADVAKRYIERYVRGLDRKKGPMRTASDTEYAINRYLVPRWGKLPITAITPDHIKELCDEFERRSVVAHARNVFSITRSLFKWAVGKRDYALERSPCDGLEPGKLIGEVQPRKRVLSNAEILAFWRACETLGYPYRDLFRLILLTGTRKEEMAQARWQELNLQEKAFTIPSERFKSDRIHIVPLSEQALTILHQLPQFAAGDYVFTTASGKKAVDGFSKAKLRLDGAMQALLGATKLAPFTIHDLRRTARTRLSELRIDPIVAEAVIGHSFPGLLGIYDQHAYLNEKREALQRLANHLMDIVNPRPAERTGNVVPLSARAAQ